VSPCNTEWGMHGSSAVWDRALTLGSDTDTEPSDDLTQFLFLKLPALRVDGPRRSLIARVTASFVIQMGTLPRAKETK
jgi:hypothetical protein